MKVFPDTNVLLSGFFGAGLCASLLHRLLESEHELLVGEPVAREFVRVATDKFRVPPEGLALALEVLHRQRLVAAADEPIPGVPDPDDVPVVACAVAARSELFVTGDRALLELGEVRGLALVSPRDAWARLFVQGEG